MTINSDSKEIYQLGFQTCVINLLKKGSTISEISTMKLTNSEFTVIKFTEFFVNKTFELNGITIVAS